MNINRLLKTIIKEILLNWLISSVLMLFYSYLINNITWKILSIFSILISKYMYEDYTSKFYLNYNKPKIIKEEFKLDKIK